MEHSDTKDYYELMIDVAVLFGANKTVAEREQYDALRFEMELAKVHLWTTSFFLQISISISPFQIAATVEEPFTTSANSNTFTVQQLQEMYSYIDWMEFIEGHLNHSVTIDKNDAVIAVDKNYLLHLNNVLKSTSPRVIANYFAWRLVFFTSDLLNDALYKRKWQYFNERTTLTANIRIAECVKKAMHL